ncbi:lysyl oxidase homolog 3B isoform X2 [Clarias gariepinus]|uniref:lysyl oxidase homolog 3B isoform X2 n=1 Tax=Clarias gariepinus TaxID=13013 RepID=UPI00234D707F|nr:lysyl oxidase homolog 3B isoform X2 [Clarias gariepinus]
MEQSQWWRHVVFLFLGIWVPSFFAQTATTVRPSPTPTVKAPGYLKFRLAGHPRKHNEGRIEVFYKGEWGTICDDDFSLANAHVLCRHLGFVSATGWAHSAKYGKGAGKIWLDNVQCSGSERSISVCKSRGWGNSDCTHDEDAGVICKDERLPGFVDSNIIEVQVDERNVEEVRLRPVVSSKRLPVIEGVVEVRYKDRWAQICDNGWTPKNSRVVCGMMGFPNERKVNKNFYKNLRKRSTEPKVKNRVKADRQEDKAKKASSKSKPGNSGTGKRLYAERQKNYFLVHSVACLGTEVHLAACPLEFTEANATESCPGGMPAVVSCVPGPEYAQNRAMKKNFKSLSTVRLKGGAKPGEGRVEVLKGSEWGTVCDDRWNIQSASVVCRELGYGSAKEALTGARMGQGFGPIYMNEVQCTGHERSLWNCRYKNITAEDCKHTEDAAVRCNVPYMGFEKTVRITGGRTRYEGRVEVLRTSTNGTQHWGLICGEGWGTKEAMVVCRQLGLGYSNHGMKETWYWDGSNVTNMVMSGVKCTGDELALSQCQQHRTLTCQKTAARFAAGVICSETASDLIMNAPLVQQTGYIEDRPLHMLYCAAEEDCLSESAAKVNWPYGHRRLLRFTSQIHNIGRADFRPKAGRHSWVWHACHGHYHSMDIFTHYDLLSVNGTKVAEGHKASFCLEDSDCEEGVSKRYECANFGEQGITVGCWDLYRHDIDCQWIDITDVKPGNYIMQIVINPNFEVSESDYTNNVMKCNCKYDGNRIWFHNCHTGDAFSEEAERKFEKYPGQINNEIS